ncbi:HSP20 family protein [Butyrivibrio fibrisolvens DSM 3071]|uniref:HSP20 family protein n=1 Tax=Butyrivibrio fibrisolvens DSM 3071 TaxID=1121131 RepID=A0A1M5YPL5_BUTFI|nr:Hsp20/alpha crystallin family protein [Butyrivibrio fibrisolvens]SHI13819.1 HSP20 family protein [Butyrivibrio fibrisolvens DSM 3071]
MMRTGRRNQNCGNRYYNDAFDLMDDMFTNFWGTGLESTSNMRTDVIEEENDYQLITDLPGFEKSDINISLKEDILTITASHKDAENKEADDKKPEPKYIRRERVKSSFERTFRVENVTAEDISAAYENGVLTVTIPKKQPVEPETKRIAIA